MNSIIDLVSSSSSLQYIIMEGKFELNSLTSSSSSSDNEEDEKKSISDNNIKIITIPSSVCSSNHMNTKTEKVSTTSSSPAPSPFVSTTQSKKSKYKESTSMK